MTRKEKKNRMYKEAQERNEKWAETSLKDQLASIDERLGKGIGAKRQRARIQEQIVVQVRKEEKAKQNGKSSNKNRQTKQKKSR